MSKPQAPPHLNPDLVYLHVTTPADPANLATSFRPPASGDGSITYIGPVGELKGEHIYEVKVSNGPLRRDSPEGQRIGGEVAQALKAAQGVKGVKLLDVKQRSKRGGDL